MKYLTKNVPLPFTACEKNLKNSKYMLSEEEKTKHSIEPKSLVKSNILATFDQYMTV